MSPESYQVVLQNYLTNRFNAQIFLTNFHFTTKVSDQGSDEELVSFPDNLRLVEIGKRTFLYGSSNETLSFVAPQDATHILYETSGELILPLMLKIDGDNFSVLLEDGWVDFTYPLSLTDININTLYCL